MFATAAGLTEYPLEVQRTIKGPTRFECPCEKRREISWYSRFFIEEIESRIWIAENAKVPDDYKALRTVTRSAIHFPTLDALQSPLLEGIKANARDLGLVTEIRARYWIANPSFHSREVLIFADDTGAVHAAAVEKLAKDATRAIFGHQVRTRVPYRDQLESLLFETNGDLQVVSHQSRF